VDDRASLGGQRVLVVDRGAPSAELALELVPHAGRVVFLSSSRELAFPADLRQRLKASDVKILLESDLLEITGLGEVEKALVHDRVEDQDYHLAVDAVVDLAEPPPG
jgi:nitrogen fixation NifU-like protein